MSMHAQNDRRQRRSIAVCSPVLAGLLTLLSGAGCQRDAGFPESAQNVALQAAAAVDVSQLRPHVQALLAARQTEEPVLSPYFRDMPLRRTQAADYIDRVWRSAGFTPTHETAEQGGVRSENLYVDIRGSVQPQQYVLITGHYDNWHLGADDNASAIAVLLQAAQVFAARRPARSIRIVAFDREEEGLTGSERFAALHESDAIRAVLNMDCVAYLSRAENSQGAPPGLGLRSVGDFLAVLSSEPAARILSSVARLAPLLPQPVDVLGLVAPADGHNAGAAAFLRSDHAPFWRRGIPALFFTDTANFRNPNYHRPGDVAETLDFDFLARNAQLVIAAAAALAEEP